MTAFGRTEPLTVGVEEEFQIVDPDTGDLVSRIDEVLERAEDDYADNLQSELFQSVVETATDICSDIGQVRREITDLRESLLDVMEDKGYTLAAAGTHPFARWKQQDVTEKDRYRELIEDLQWTAKRELIFGQHVHVAVKSAEEAVYVSNWLQPFLPALLALSANSPFWRGHPTGLKSTRIRIFDALPRTGLHRTFEDYPDFRRTVETFKAGGSIEDVSKIWWDVRPRPDLGTVEVRIADIPTDADLSVALAGLTQALVAWLGRACNADRSPPLEHTLEIVQENRWRALRDGLEARFIRQSGASDEDYEGVDARDFVSWMLDELADTAADLGVEEEMDSIRALTRRGETGADRQRRIYEENDGEFLPVMRDIVERTRP